MTGAPNVEGVNWAANFFTDERARMAEVSARYAAFVRNRICRHRTIGTGMKVMSTRHLTLEELCGMTESEVLHLASVGPDTLNAAKKMLGTVGLAFKDSG